MKPRVMFWLAALAATLSLVEPAFAQRNLTVAAAPATEQRVALVIGNAAYKDSPLRNPVNDATDIARTLRELGFKTTLKTNAGQRQMKDSIREFGAELARGGVGLFYFAGHGIQYKGRNFLVPIGAAIEREAHIEDETVDAAFVLAHMEEARNRVNLVILDACRNNPYTRGMRSVSRGLAQMDATQGTLVAFATAPGSVAADGEGRNGVYTKHLLKQVRQPGVPVELMFKRVRDGVIDETREMQTPWEASSLRGANFYFRPGTATASPAAGALAADPAAVEIAFWDSVKDSRSAEAVQSYLDRYSSGHFVALAKVKLRELSEPAQAATSQPGSSAERLAGIWTSAFKDMTGATQVRVSSSWQGLSADSNGRPWVGATQVGEYSTEQVVKYRVDTTGNSFWIYKDGKLLFEGSVKDSKLTGVFNYTDLNCGTKTVYGYLVVCKFPAQYPLSGELAGDGASILLKYEYPEIGSEANWSFFGQDTVTLREKSRTTLTERLVRER